MNLKLIRICISNRFRLVHAIPNNWKKTLTENSTNRQNPSYFNHHFIKSNQIYSVEKLTTKDLYLRSPQHEANISTLQKYFESMFQDLALQCKQFYTLSRITTIDSKLQCFQHKALYNNLYQNAFSFFRKHNTSLCLFCNLEDKTVIHVFVLCSKTKRLRCTVIEHFKRNIILYYYHRVPFWSDDKVFLILNHLLLLFKYYVYFEEVQKLFLLKSYLQSIMKVYKLEKTLDQSDERKKNYLQETFKRT